MSGLPQGVQNISLPLKLPCCRLRGLVQTVCSQQSAVPEGMRSDIWVAGCCPLGGKQQEPEPKATHHIQVTLLAAVQHFGRSLTQCQALNLQNMKETLVHLQPSLTRCPVREETGWSQSRRPGGPVGCEAQALGRLVRPRWLCAAPAASAQTAAGPPPAWH